MSNFVEEFEIKKYMPSKQDLNQLATFFSAFSDDTRLRILVILTIKPLCVSTITNILQIKQSTISHQLKLLKHLGVVNSERKGKNIFYYICKSEIEMIFNIAVDCF